MAESSRQRLETCVGATHRQRSKQELFRVKRWRRNAVAAADHRMMAASTASCGGGEGVPCRYDLSKYHIRSTTPSSSPQAKLWSVSRLDDRHRYHIRHLRLPWLFCLLFALLLQLSSARAAAATCLRFADYDSINALLTSGGPGTVIQLCPSKTYRMSGAIIFTAADQEITTFGNPTDHTRAVLRMQGNGETAIQGDCRRCKGVKVRSLVIDGNRRKLGRSRPTEEAGGLVILGGNEGQVVQDCEIRDPRGFTAIHVREGNKVDCTGARITGNVIGPVGEEYDPKKDGDDPELSPLGRPLADGITVACRDSVIKHNILVDNTAAGIVLYCSPGTVVENNTVTADKASAMAGILMVDATPFKADYSGVVVKDNTVAATGAAMRIGIGIGPTVWSDDTETILKGGTVVHNTLAGTRMGYGIAAAGLSGWTIMDNVNEAEYEGKRGERCFPEAVNPAPQAFIYTKATMKDCEIQEGFVDEQFQYAACLDPIDSSERKQTVAKPPKQPAAANRKVVKPQSPVDAAAPAVPAGKDRQQKVLAGKGGQPDDPPLAGKKVSGKETGLKTAAADPVGSAERFDTGSEVMDGILEHSRTRLLEAIEQLGGRVDGLFGMEDSAAVGNTGPAKRGTANGGINGLKARVEALERDQARLIDDAMGLRTGMQVWNKDMTKVHAWEHEILMDIQARLHDHFASDPSEQVKVSPGEHHDDHSGHEANQAILEVPHDQAGKGSKGRQTLRQRAERARLLGLGGLQGAGKGSWFRLGALATLLLAIVLGWRRWRRTPPASGSRSPPPTPSQLRSSTSAPTLGSAPPTNSSARAQARVSNGGPHMMPLGWSSWFWSKGNHRKEM